MGIILRMLDLCTGLASFSLAARWTGYIETIAFSEIDPFCCRLLARNFPGIPNLGDIHGITDDTLAELGNIDLICAGVPCQPRSRAGKRRGTEDDRDLWQEVRRIIATARPDAVVVEQPDGVLSMDVNEWVADLEGTGYEVGSVVLPAAAVGAPHQRYRLFLLAYAQRFQRERGGEFGHMGDSSGASEGWTEERKRIRDATGDSSADVSHADDHCPDNKQTSGEAQPSVGGDDDGISAWLDRPDQRWPALMGQEQHEWEPPRTVDGNQANRTAKLRALGNAVVPQLAYEVLMALLRAIDPVLHTEES